MPFPCHVTHWIAGSLGSAGLWAGQDSNTAPGIISDWPGCPKAATVENFTEMYVFYSSVCGRVGFYVAT